MAGADEFWKAAGEVAKAIAQILGPETQSYPECNSIPRTNRKWGKKVWTGLVHKYPDHWEIMQTYPTFELLVFWTPREAGNREPSSRLIYGP